MNKFDLLIKFPTRGRPDKFRNQFDKYYNFLSKELNVGFVVSMDEDDVTMNNEDMRWWLSEANGNRKNIFYHYGKSKSKVEAINSDMQHYQSWSILLLASDDMTVKEFGYDKIIYDDMIKYFPDLDGVLHYNDDRAKERLNTLVVMGRKMYDYFGYIYHPQYKSLFCDNEFDSVTKKMKKSQYIDRVIIKHDWVDYTGKDRLHIRNESFYKSDGALYKKREAKNFPKQFV